MSYIEKMCFVNWRFRSFVQYRQCLSKHGPNPTPTNNRSNHKMINDKRSTILEQTGAKHWGWWLVVVVGGGGGVCVCVWGGGGGLELFSLAKYSL